MLFPGSFDPPHLGHLDVMRRAAALGELVVGVAIAPNKPGFLSMDVRSAVLRAMLDEAGLTQVSVITYAGATIEAAREHGCTALVRGLRNHLDLEHERVMAEVHRRLGLDTLFLLAQGEHVHLSSSMVRHLGAAGLAMDEAVPPAVARVLATRQ